MFYKPKHYKTFEVLPPSIVCAPNDWETAYKFIDERVMISADQIRDFFGTPCYSNTYHESLSDIWEILGKRTDSGYRPPYCHTGAANSTHKYGRGLDNIVLGIHPAEVIKTIIKNQERFPLITRIENIKTHLHFDVRCCFHHGIYLFNP